MRDAPDKAPPDNPIEAARRGARPQSRRRFYDKVAVARIGDRYAVQLDDKPVLTPARRSLAAPTPALAHAIATEWEQQRDTIDPASMPLTRLANAIIDGVADTPHPVAAEIAKYLASDLLFYRAAEPAGLIARQAQHWDPILAWARDSLGASFRTGQGVVPISQDNTAVAAARAAIPDDPWLLGALHAATTLTGSALLALALAAGRLSVEDTWLAAHIDEDWNMELWGRDDSALERRAVRFAEFQAAAAILKTQHRP